MNKCVDIILMISMIWILGISVFLVYGVGERIGVRFFLKKKRIILFSELLIGCGFYLLMVGRNVNFS